MKSYQEFESRFRELRDHKMDAEDLKEHNYRMYVLTPYVSMGLAYEIFDLNTSMMMDNGSTFRFKPPVLEGLAIYFSLLPDYTRFKDEADRAYVHIDVDNNQLSMYFKVFNEWHLVNVVEFFAEDEDDRQLQADILTSINQTLHLSAFNDNYPNLQERYFTSVVMDNMVAKGEVLNVFVRKALVQELQEPTGALVRLLASVLQEYTTQTEEWVVEALDPIREQGVVSLIEEAVSKDELKLRHIPKPTPTPPTLRNTKKAADAFRTPKKQVVEEKVDNFIGDKMDELSRLGFADASDKEDKPATTDLTSKQESVKDLTPESKASEPDLVSEDGTVDLMKLS